MQSHVRLELHIDVIVIVSEIICFFCTDNEWQLDTTSVIILLEIKILTDMIVTPYILYMGVKRVSENNNDLR